MVKSHQLFNALVGCIKILTGSFYFIIKVVNYLNNALKVLGVGNSIREENDYYATDPIALHKLLKYESFNKNIWEPACGEGNLSEVLKEYNYNVYSTDLINRGYGEDFFDFLETNNKWCGDIITNPPFKHDVDFILKALDSIEFGSKVCFLLKLNSLAGVKRYKEVYSKFPPSKIYVFSKRVACSKNNKKEGFKSGCMDYGWFIWEKGVIGPTNLKWIE